MDPLLMFANAVMLAILGVRNIRGYKRRIDAGPNLPSFHPPGPTGPSPSFDARRLQLPDEPIDKERNSSFAYGIVFLAFGALMASRGIYLLLHR